MKKTLVFAMAVLCVFALAACCTTTETHTSTVDGKTVTTTTETVNGVSSTTTTVTEAEPAQEKESTAEAAEEEKAAPAEENSSTSAAGEEIYADITVRDYGTITVKLDRSAAPITVDNFVKLAESGFYDGLTFHRIMEGFMMQGGDPTGTGMGGSEEKIKGEFKANGVDNPLSHTAGAISMARSQLNDSASSQFFIVHEDSTFLDGQYAVFGYVTDGMDIVDKICRDAKPVDNNGTIPAAQQPVMESIRIR